MNQLRHEESRISLPSGFIERLLAVLPATALIVDQDGLGVYECDALTAYRTRPAAVALPADEEQIRHVLACCREFRVPVVPRGAGTSLSGGAQPIAHGLVLSTARLSRVLRVDASQRLAVVQPGVTNLGVSAAARNENMFYAPDPSSQIACTLGGNVAANSGGVRCMKYGLTVHNVLALRGLNSEGEVVELGSTGLDTPGPDLLALVCGSEGMLLVITEVTVRLMPLPAAAQVVMASFRTVEQAAQAVVALVGSGITPSGLEMMDQGAVRAVEPFVHAGYDTEAAAILLCESDGTSAHVEAEMAHIHQVLKSCDASGLRFSQNEQERLLLWAGRKSAFPAAGRISPDYYCMDSTIPRKHLATLLSAIQRMTERYGLGCINVFHAGDGNMHPLILYDAQEPGQLERAEAFGAEILEESLRLGGTITGEHGVGIEKLNQMCSQFNSDELQLFHDIKAAFDPAGLLNPNKGIPTLHRCIEHGKKHVHSATATKLEVF